MSVGIGIAAGIGIGIAASSAPCNWRVKVPCTCPCVDVEWSTWSALSASCGVTVKVRYKPILGQPTSLCTPENSTRCCSEHEQVVLEPCSEYHHGTDILFKQKPCVHGVQVPHLEGGSRCDCMVDYAGMLCNIKIGGSTEKVRQLSAIITNVVIVVCSVLLALAVFMFAMTNRHENASFPACWFSAKCSKELMCPK